MPGSLDPAQALQPRPRPRPPDHLLPESARPALTSSARGPGPLGAMLSRPGLSGSEPRASAQVANVAAGAQRPRPGGSGYRPGGSPPSTHQASGSAESPRLAHWRETEALEVGDPPEPQNSSVRGGLELRTQPQATHRPPAQHRRRIRGALFLPKVSPYSPSSLSPIPLPSRALRAKADMSSDRGAS